MGVAGGNNYLQSGLYLSSVPEKCQKVNLPPSLILPPCLPPRLLPPSQPPI